MHRYCLIGEADPFIARLLNRFAEESGLEAMNAKQGEDLLKLAQERLPLVILLDVELPGELRGWEAFRELRGNPITKKIPIVICSWLTQAEARSLSGELAIHLQKPDLHYQDFCAALVQVGVGETLHQLEDEDGA